MLSVVCPPSIWWKAIAEGRSRAQCRKAAGKLATEGRDGDEGGSDTFSRARRALRIYLSIQREGRTFNEIFGAPRALRGRWIGV
jgi:hypothetical protein